LVLAVLSSCLAWSLASAMPARIGVEYAVTLALVTVAGVVASRRWYVERDRDAESRWRRFEAGGAAIGAKLLHVVFLGGGATTEIATWPEGFLEQESILGWLLAIGVGIATHASFADLAALGAPIPHTALAAPLTRLWQRFLASGVLLAVAAAAGLVGWGAVMDLTRPPVRAFLAPAFVFFPVGLWGLGRAARADEEGRWRWLGATVDHQVRGRWMVAVAVVLVPLLLGVLLLPSLSGLVGALPLAVLAGVAAMMAGLRDWLLSVLRPAALETGPGAVPSRIPTTTVSGVEGSPPPPIDPEVVRAAELRLFWLAVVLVVVVVALRVGEERKALGEAARHRLGLRGWLALLARAITGLPAALLRILRAFLTLFRRTRMARPADAPEVAASLTPGMRRPLHGPAARVAKAYRAFLEVTGATFGPRRPAETPAEYQDRLGPPVPGGAAAWLTRLFEVARWSTHPVQPAEADSAEAAFAEVAASLGTSLNGG